MEKLLLQYGKDAKGYPTTVEVVCSKECEHRLNKKCKMKGTLKFALDGIEANGVWKLTTSGETSLSNIFSEIYSYKKQGKSLMGIPFELTLSEQETMAFGKVYIINLKMQDEGLKIAQLAETKAVPQLNAAIETERTFEEVQNEKFEKVLEESEKNEKATPKPKTSIKEKETANVKETTILEQKETTKASVETETVHNNNNEIDSGADDEESNEQVESGEEQKWCYYKGVEDITINGQTFKKLMFQRGDNKDVEYVLHPKADQNILELEAGSVILPTNIKAENEKEILCKYDIIQNIEELKKAG